MDKLERLIWRYNRFESLYEEWALKDPCHKWYFKGMADAYADEIEEITGEPFPADEEGGGAA